MKKLFLIPARGGSKGLPRKNILPLNGKPMLFYSIDAAKDVAEVGDEICVSTDDQEIIQLVENYNIKVPFVRPDSLASDAASSEEVINHAIEWYAIQNIFFDIVVLLQPTSPLRTSRNIKEALDLWSTKIDMVVSVKETDSNPYYVLFEEECDGFLYKSKNGNFTRRQDCPKVYEYNGAIYIINISALKAKSIKNFNKVQKYLMSKNSSIDVDDSIDFNLIELIMKRN